MFTEKVANHQFKEGSALRESDQQTQVESVPASSASSMTATKIILANEKEQKRIFGQFMQMADGADQSSNAETDDYFTCKDSFKESRYES